MFILSILNVLGLISKNEAMKLMQNVDLTEKKRKIVK